MPDRLIDAGSIDAGLYHRLNTWLHTPGNAALVEMGNNGDDHGKVTDAMEPVLLGRVGVYRQEEAYIGEAYQPLRRVVAFACEKPTDPTDKISISVISFNPGLTRRRGLDLGKASRSWSPRTQSVPVEHVARFTDTVGGRNNLVIQPPASDGSMDTRFSALRVGLKPSFRDRKPEAEAPSPEVVDWLSENVSRMAGIVIGEKSFTRVRGLRPRAKNKMYIVPMHG